MVYGCVGGWHRDMEDCNDTNKSKGRGRQDKVGETGQSVDVCIVAWLGDNCDILASFQHHFLSFTRIEIVCFIDKEE